MCWKQEEGEQEEMQSTRWFRGKEGQEERTFDMGYRMKNQREVESWREIFRCRDEVMENFQGRSRTNV